MSPLGVVWGRSYGFGIRWMPREGPALGTGPMAKPGHAWSRPKSQEEEEEDPVEAMVSRTGCAEQHWALQECMAEQRDWRRCQAQVQAFRQCMARQQRPHPEELHPNPPQCSPHGD
ncbi:cytochrome c oxidase assembly factor 4 homolog, mitochondrial isoform X1 [Lagopus muta]|uniref:cytochrome c oxidase assembly factor 4 homolog, mitochondrial isoform X1 n=1 Tax=Lagopus muta TaxID=64668 RepID=UPI00209DB78F|nr:cytochrome c oxidase assembly factor 4 homolog, mitochondrial isoform X1 [Lagopus muta]